MNRNFFFKVISANILEPVEKFSVIELKWERNKMWLKEQKIFGDSKTDH